MHCRQRDCELYGVEVGQAARYCTSCGTRFAEACSECGETVQPEAKHCGACGHPTADLDDVELAGELDAHERWLNSDEAEGRRADLRAVNDLKRRQLPGGAPGAALSGRDLTGALLPKDVAWDREIAHIDDLVGIARPLYLVLLVVSIYTIITAISTNDLSLVKNSPIQLLPETGLGVPVSRFFVSVPLLLFGFYIYFQLYLVRMWRVLGTLPAVLPDGTPNFRTIPAWLCTTLLRYYQPRWQTSFTSGLEMSQKGVTIIFIWWAPTFALLVLWLRYLVRHDWPGTTLHSVLVVLGIWSAIVLHRLAVEQIRGRQSPYRGVGGALRSLVILAVVALPVATVSLGVFFAVRSEFEAGNPRTWVPAAMTVLRVDPFADLINANLDNVDLEGADLRGANLSGASLVNTNLDRAQLQGANLSSANLDAASLRFANLDGAILWKASLRRANLSNAKLQGVVMTEANALGASFYNAILQRARLNSGIFMQVEFANADLTSTDLSDSNFRGSDFQFASLANADLSRARMDSVKFIGAKLHRADMLSTRLDGSNLLKIEGLTKDQLTESCGSGVKNLHPKMRVWLRQCSGQIGASPAT